jgi:serine/threonine protein phosphatase PrpC
MTLAIRHACLSDRGRTHELNEDRWHADPARGLYLVADGMADERPAQQVVDLLPPLLAARLGGPEDLADPRVREQVADAITEVSNQVRDLETTGSTLVLVLIRDGLALVAHMGDSRVYLLRHGSLEQLTRDHSWLQWMVEHGEITAEEASQARSNGGPTRFLGMWGQAVPELRLLELCAGDRLLLCSDGLPEMLPAEQLHAVLAREPEPEAACRRLIDEANAAGGRDNLTALVIAADTPA